MFADALPHVPEHRQLPILTQLVTTLGPAHFLWVLMLLLFKLHTTQGAGSTAEKVRWVLIGSDLVRPEKTCSLKVTRCKHPLLIRAKIKVHFTFVQSAAGCRTWLWKRTWTSGFLCAVSSRSATSSRPSSTS